MTRDEELIKFWQQRMLNNKENGIEELELQNGSIAYTISQLIKDYNTNADRIAYTKWHYWYQIVLTRRVLKKFKVKVIYRSKKAKEYYHKLLWKKGKVKGDRLEDVHKDKVIAYLNAMAINDSLEKFPLYQYIIERINK